MILVLNAMQTLFGNRITAPKILVMARQDLDPQQVKLWIRTAVLTKLDPHVQTDIKIAIGRAEDVMRGALPFDPQDFPMGYPGVEPPHAA